MMELIRATKIPAFGVVCAAALRARYAHATAARGLVLVVDQAVASATNFLTTIIIGRACLPEELGLYSLGFSLAIVLMSVPRALIWTPYTTYAPGMDDRRRMLYSGSTLIHQVVLCALLALVISVVGAGVTPFENTPGLGMALIVLGPAIALMYLREYARRICFAQLRAKEALAVDLAVGVLQSAGIYILAANGALTASRALAIIAVASAPVVGVWILANRQGLLMSRKSTVSDFTRNWHFGRWVCAGALVASFNYAMDPWVLSWMHGTSATGVYGAARSVIMLINPILLSYHNFFGPHAAHVYAREGLEGLWPLAIRASLTIAAFLAAFTLAISFWGGDLLVFLFGHEYAGNGNVVTALVLSEICAIVSLPVTLSLLAVGRGDILLKSNLVQLFLAVTVGLWCIWQWGAAGVGYSGLAAGIGTALWKWSAFQSLIKND